MIQSYKNHWIDENNNRWSKYIFTKEQAEEHSKSLINCKNCDNCYKCKFCYSCENCKDLKQEVNLSDKV